MLTASAAVPARHVAVRPDVRTVCSRNTNDQGTLTYMAQTMQPDSHGENSRYHGWLVVAGAFTGMLLANGFFTYGFTLLVNPLRAEFDATLEQVMYSLTLGTLSGLVISPLIGSLVDRYSVRHLMTLGCLITSAGLFVIAQAQTLLAFNILFGITMAIGLGSMSSLTGSAVVSRWFTQNRGRALGIAAMGTSVGGVIVPALLTWWVNTSGWRDSIQNMALLILLVATPVIWLTIRNRPAEQVVPPAQTPQQPSAAPTQVSSPGMGDIIRMRSFWLIGLSMGMFFAAFSSMLANLSPYAASLGTEETAISVMIAVLSVSGLIGKFLFGSAADRIDLKHGLWAAHVLLLLAFGLLLLEPPYWLLLVAATCFGLSTGGLIPVWNAIVARLFGVASFGRAMGAMAPVITLCILPAYTVLGSLTDSTGSYSAGLLLFSGVIAVAAALLVPLRLPQ